MFRNRVGLNAAFCFALGIHVLFANTFEFTFPDPKFPSKPIFVFLGSFLRTDDVTMAAFDDLKLKEGVYNQRLNLDIRSGSISRDLTKPDLTGRVGLDSKHQYKPEISIEPKQVIGPTNDLGIDFGPFETIRMRMDQRDQD